MIDILAVRKDFLILNQKIYGKSLIYFDNAASSLKPRQVIDRVKKYYENETSNIHRSSHFLGSQGTTSYEASRTLVQKFIGAKNSAEIIFTRGTTESINLVAQSYGQNLKAGDEIILSELEHHSNIVPWQLVAERQGAKIRVIPVDMNGVLQFEAFKELLNSKTKILSLTMCSNTLGTIIDVKKYIELAHETGAVVFLDAAQEVAHSEVDVEDLDCDFLAFSGHKIYAPYGIGILYGKEYLLNEMTPYQGGGSMISQVTFEKTTYADLPQKFEAGTPSIADAIGLGEAILYINEVGLENMAPHLEKLLDYGTKACEKIEGLKILGPREPKAPIISFTMAGLHPSDIGSLIDQDGIAIRTGHHCTQPLLRKMGLTATARASFSIYNTTDEIDFFVEALKKAKGLLQ
jgi:cysteine desulfurase/selenocysteine lyase